MLLSLAAMAAAKAEKGADSRSAFPFEEEMSCTFVLLGISSLLDSLRLSEAAKDGTGFRLKASLREVVRLRVSSCTADSSPRL